MAVVLAAIVVATMAGRLVGRRIRLGRERRAARWAPAATPMEATSRVVVTRAAEPPQADGEAPAPAATPADNDTKTITAAAAGQGRTSSPSGSTRAPSTADDAGVRSMRERLAMPEVVGTSAFARRLAAGPPPVATRRPSGLSPAQLHRGGQSIVGAGSRAAGTGTASNTAGPGEAPGSMPPRHRDRRRDAGLVLGIAGAVVIAVGIVLGWPGTHPSGNVLEASGTPDTSLPGAGVAASTPTSLQPSSETSGDGVQPSGTSGPATPTAGDQTVVRVGQRAVVGPAGSTFSAGASPTVAPGAAATPAPTPTGGAAQTPTPTPGSTPPATPTPAPATPTPRPTPAPTPTPTPTPAPTPTPTPAPTPTATPQAPNVEFTFAVNGLHVTFSNKTKGAASYDWSFGDGQTATTRSPSHTYAAAGTYSVTLTATADGASASVTHAVSVGG